MDQKTHLGRKAHISLSIVCLGIAAIRQFDKGLSMDSSKSLVSESGCDLIRWRR
ncbi:MAG: hypothetical protein P8J86_09290 [Phycisphaerales bacterium]|nr:hypothetical protein [Phycisphaerales bacterium]